MPSKILLKDIVIPAGTVFNEAPKLTRRCGCGHYSHVLGLSDDTSGDLTYFVDEDDPAMGEWFAPAED